MTRPVYLSGFAEGYAASQPRTRSLARYAPEKFPQQQGVLQHIAAAAQEPLIKPRRLAPRQPPGTWRACPAVARSAKVGFPQLLWISLWIRSSEARAGPGTRPFTLVCTKFNQLFFQ